MKILAVFIAILASYMAPLYFSGDLSIPMLLECGIRSGVIVSFCAYAYKDFPVLKLIMVIELTLIFAGVVIIADWESRYTNLDQIIGTMNNIAFLLELILLVGGGIYEMVSARNNDHNFDYRANDSAKGGK